MPQISYIHPTDQPLGNNRLLALLKCGLASEEFQEFGLAVAFAKVGPLLRLEEYLDQWLSRKKVAYAIIGVDQVGTSKQALEFLLDRGISTHITSYPGHSFHPKIYWFKGASKARVIFGSNNLTVGGTELNFEASVIIDFMLPSEEVLFNEAKAAFNGLLPSSCSGTFALTDKILQDLDANGLLLDETKRTTPSTASSSSAMGASAKNTIKTYIGNMAVKPPSNIGTKGKLGAKPKIASASTSGATGPMKSLIPVRGLAIQIRVYDNGEIFLSKNAALQNPAFFGLPFTGRTTPKKATNTSYPERSPDPVCNIFVYGKKNELIKSLSNYNLNTVLYEEKSEIRITIGPLVGHVPEYSILLMSQSSQVGVDYQLDFYLLDSPDYPYWDAVCDQKMPGGGKEPRRFGWF